MKQIVYFFLVILFFSCKENTKHENDESLVNEKALESLVEVVGGNENFKDEFEKLPIKKLPIIDSTSFDSFIDEDDIKKINAIALKLPEVYDNWFEKRYDYQLISGYRVPFSKDFYSAVLTVKRDEHEMESTLVNYDLEGNVIDSEIISFDEIAESWVSIVSKIENNSIAQKRKFVVNEDDGPVTENRTIKILANGTLKELSENELIFDFFAKVLKIENQKRIESLEAFKVQPNNPNEAIVVIPEIVEGSEEEGYFLLNTHIAIVDLNTKSITHHYFESHKTNGWISDAIRIDKIEIDTAPYFVKENTRAFGVRITFIGSSQVNPYFIKTLSLYVKEQQEIKNVLHNFSVEDNTGEWDGNCKGNFTDINKTLILSANKTNNYFDILVKQKTLQTTTSLSDEGDCYDDEEILESKFVLKFDGSKYIEEGTE